MNNYGIENAIIVRNKTRLELLTARFNTQSQAKFYIEQSQKSYKAKKAAVLPQVSKSEQTNAKVVPQKQVAANQDADFSEYEIENKKFYDSLALIKKIIGESLKIKEIDQSFLPNFVFSEKDLVFVVGQDGLVANTAKYVNNIPIIAINPDNSRYDGVLLPFSPDNFATALANVLNNSYQSRKITMAEVKLNDGQRLLAFNDFFIGVTSHSSARYQITIGEQTEPHSSSGIIVSTGAGSTGWLSSVFNMANGIIRSFSNQIPLNFKKVSQEYENLFYVVREPFVSKISRAEIVAGEILKGEVMTLESFMPSNGVIFSDGVQADFLQFNSGAIAEIGVAREKAILVTG